VPLLGLRIILSGSRQFGPRGSDQSKLSAISSLSTDWPQFCYTWDRVAYMACSTSSLFVGEIIGRADKGLTTGRTFLVVQHRAGGGVFTQGPCSKARLCRSPSIPNNASSSQPAMNSLLIAATNVWSTRSMQGFLSWTAAPVQLPIPSGKPICSSSS